jgi:hypothetical protein
MIAHAIAAPVQRNATTMPKYSSSSAPDRAAAAEQQQQEIADHHRRQHQRQMHDRVEHAFPGEIAAREQDRHRYRKREAARDAPECDFEAQGENSPFRSP